MASVNDERQPSSVTTARLHLHRGPGVIYVAIAVVVALIAVSAVFTYVSRREFLFGAVLLIVGLGISALVGWFGLSILAPQLNVNGERIMGRITLNQTVDVPWSEVVIDVDDDSPRGQFRLDLGPDSITVDISSWDGFGNFVLLLASLSVAANRLTPAARTEVARLLQLDDSAPPVDPETVG